MGLMDGHDAGMMYNGIKKLRTLIEDSHALQTAIGWILASSGGDSFAELISASVVAGVFGWPEPHFPGAQWSHDV